MSPRWLPLVMCIAAACGGSRPSSKEPTTAKEKQLQEARAKGEDEPQKAGKKWTGWKYQGDRDDCFFIVGKRCFKTQDAACKAARCGNGKTCQTEGAGPAAVSCK